jgi:hypothetical protein
VVIEAARCEGPLSASQNILIYAVLLLELSPVITAVADIRSDASTVCSYATIVADAGIFKGFINSVHQQTLARVHLHGLPR